MIAEYIMTVVTGGTLFQFFALDVLAPTADETKASELWRVGLLLLLHFAPMVVVDAYCFWLEGQMGAGLSDQHLAYWESTAPWQVFVKVIRGAVVLALVLTLCLFVLH